MTYSDWDVERKDTATFPERAVPPAEAIPARICAIVDVGSHDAKTMDGEAYVKRCLILGFELDERDSTGKPFVMSKLYTLSLHLKSNLYAVVKAIHGELPVGSKFNPAFLAGKGCQLQIGHETKNKKGVDRTYANITDIIKLGRGQAAPRGGCVVWRVADAARVPLPDLSHLPPLWHEDSSRMLTVAEWVTQSHEVRGVNGGPSTAADSRMPRPHATSNLPRVEPATTPIEDDSAAF